ncbi:MAG: DUF389 domain-containing protein [Chloroflexi bacterium]|nr:DUF389 domain-containing protein [Chloroflexota bacterium]
MSLSDEPIIPTEPPQPESDPVRGRRRRATRRSSIPTDPEGQAALISALSRRAYPSIELFVFSLACGAILGLGFFLDSQAVLLLGILAAPLMIPWVGFLLASLTGSFRFLFETFMALLISAVLVFIGGLLIGVLIRFTAERTLTNVFLHARLWPPALVVLAIGAITLVVSFARSEEKPFLPSVIVAYAFYLPINAAGFGIGSGLPGVWPQAILVFCVHFMLASILGLVTLLALRLRPTLRGIAFSGITLAAFAGTLFILMGSGFPSTNDAGTISTSTPTMKPSPLPTLTPSLTLTVTSSPRPSSTPTRTPKAAATSDGTITATATKPTSTPVTNSPTPTRTQSATNTPTLTAEPTIILGKVNAPAELGGANLRQTPGGQFVKTLDNGTVVNIYSDFRQTNGETWIHVFVTIDGKRYEGWLLETVLSYATPEPNFGPTQTPTP